MLKQSLSLQFLGTGSGRSTIARATQSIVLSIRNGYKIGEWMFDCGDMTTHQMNVLQRVERKQAMEKNTKPVILRPSRVSRIFITHMHGDHILGLPAFLLEAGISRNQGKTGVYSPIDVYGPPGLSHYLKTVFQLTDAKQNHPCIIHEMYESENDPRLSHFSKAENTLEYSDKRIQMTPLFPEKDGFWSLVESPLGTVRASSIHHTIECFGYVFRSSPPSFMINDEEVRSRLSAHQEEMMQFNLSSEDVLRRLHRRQIVKLPSGFVLDPNDVSLSNVPNLPVKTVGILGDTDNACNAYPLLQNCDVLVHEATTIPLARELQNRTIKEAEEATKRTGHSTVTMAGRFGKSVGAKKLVLTHVSPRYPATRPDHPDMKEMRNLAVEAFGSEEVVIASDLMRMDV